ncbi:MAG: phosphoribosylaminoimidazolesuccinocarboxamide synthase [Armatimonadetes bacterium]|jgi:phosphoribosylaminoimidazole-succinocarboxamide synthase|nr:phosphoribosylaminoimidazolesuccinocarboxamide synthase [Armatimonadota bacterium]
MIVTSTDIAGLKKHITGKVRDVYDLGDSLLIVASDRLSAFDVVLPSGIPDKGKVLTQISLFWFEMTADVVENHVISADIDEILDRIATAGAKDSNAYREMLDGRSMVVVKTQPYPIECVVRGYLSGSAWNEYLALREVSGNGDSIVLHGVELPGDMVESQKLPKPVFTPSTKESEGHDVNISAARAREIVGYEAGAQLESISLAVYKRASEYAAERGVIIADTKFEIGRLGERMILIDEALTPDSSRFWDVETYEPGKSQPSFDKQFVRDYLLTLDWDKTYPGPELPDEIAKKTADKYREAYCRIVGRTL